MLEDLKREFPDAQGKRHFLVTEVTHMNAGDVCVAAIDLQRLRIVRPLQWNHHNWPRHMVAAGLRPGRVVRQQIRSQQDNKGYPHQTEDVQLRDTLEITSAILPEPDLFRTLEPVVDGSISEIFNGNIIDNKYVIDGTKCRSLGLVLLDAADISFGRNTYDKWRLNLTDASTSYDLPVTDLRVHEEVKGGRGSRVARAIADAAHRRELLLLRVGLARGWAGRENEYDPKRCYLQVNGLIFETAPGY